MNTITNPFVTPADSAVIMSVCICVFLFLCVAYVVARTYHAHNAVERSIRSKLVSEAHEMAELKIKEHRFNLAEAKRLADEADKATKPTRPVTQKRGFKFNIHVEFK